MRKYCLWNFVAIALAIPSVADQGSICVLTLDPKNAAIGGAESDNSEGYTSYRFSLRIDNGPWISVPKDKPTLIDEIDAGTKHLLTLREDERVVESFWFTFDGRGSSELCFGYGYFHQTWQLHPPRGRKGCGCRSEAAG